MKKLYQLYLKSHTIAPDYEDYYESSNKDEAVEYFYNRLSPYGWDKETIEKYTYEGGEL